MKKKRLRAGIYLITHPAYKKHGGLLACFADLLQPGVGAVQYREKSKPWQKRRQEARALRGLCQRHGIPFIVNDSVALAKAVMADGVHLGQQDTAVPEARQALGKEALIGVSCHNSLALAQRAAAEGADYLSFGSLFPSASKPQAAQIRIEQAAYYCQQLKIAVVVIGGIGLANLPLALRSQADLLAIAGDIARAKVPRLQLARCLKRMQAKQSSEFSYTMTEELKGRINR